MKNYRYVIIGGGMTADAAVEGIREKDSEGSILVISSEPDPPYKRPPLSKSLWKKTPIEKIWLGTAEKEADLKLEQRVTQIDKEKKMVTTAAGDSYHYDKLLLATGGKRRTLPFGKDAILYYRTVEDFKKLHEMSAEKKRFGVIGSGFIGSEIAAALAMNGKEVVLFDIGPGIGWNVFPENMTAFLNQYYQQKGVEIVTNVKVTNVEPAGDGYKLSLNSGQTFEIDGVVAGVGIMPDTELAESLALKVDNGIHVNETLQTTDPDIYAAGDVANFYNPLLARRVRVEHADNATQMGKAAGRNMAGAQEPYDYLPFFYSDLFDLGYEAVGLLDARCELVQDWQTEFEKGVLYYLEDNRVRGVLLWNVWDKVDQAREVIGMPAPVNKDMLIGKIS
ncbi:MAG: 3-phenylpropionate/trans-cinnamate dioxygenase ferredoxin reductase component [Chloroflexota bacterium]|nr:3-phenylpropionate/trans-cinnamate dioxygenase ferredoxin reductase component [Chloroflexota bacterium]